MCIVKLQVLHNTHAHTYVHKISITVCILCDYIYAELPTVSKFGSTVHVIIISYTYIGTYTGSKG